MQLVYFAFRHSGKKQKSRASARYRGYLAACDKHRETIAEIRQYLPGWQPEFQIDSRSLHHLVIASDSADNRPQGVH